MDFHSMKRKELQALCKEHKIPANLPNQEMANRLTEFLKENENALIQRPIKGHDVNVIETESTDLAVNKKVKKVRFSPENELIEFTRSQGMKRRRSRNQGLSRYSSLSVVNGDSSEKKDLGGLGRVTRSRVLKSMEAKENVKKRGREVVKCEKNSKSSAIEIFNNGKSKEHDVDSFDGVSLLRGKMSEVGDKNTSKREKKRVKDNDKRDEKASDDNANENPIPEIVVNPGRVTRSRVQKVTEVHPQVEKRGRMVASRVDDVALASAETEENRVGDLGSFMSREDVGEGKLTKDSGERVKCSGIGEVLENKKIAAESHVSEPKILLRRSKRNANMVTDSVTLNGAKKRENCESVGLRKTSKLLQLNDSGVNAETGKEVNLGRRAVLKTEEAIKVETRRSNRRTNVVESFELKAEIENRHTLRSSVPQLGIAGEVSKGEKNEFQPTVVMRRSMPKTICLKPVSADEEINTDLTMQDLEAETKNRDLLRSSVPQLEIAGEVSKDEKNEVQPTVVLRRSRRKTVSLKPMSTDEEINTGLAVQNLEAEPKNGDLLRSSVSHLEIACGASKEEMKVIQPNGMMRRSRRKTLNLTQVSANEKIDTDAAVENLEAEKNRSEPCLGEKECFAVQKNTRRSSRIASKCKPPGVPVEIGGDSVIHQNNEVMKRKRGAISGDVIKAKNDPFPVAETMKGSSSKKAVPVAATGIVADSRKRTCRLNDFKLFDALSHNGLVSGEQFVMSAKPSASEGLGSTSNLCFNTDTSPKNIISDVGLTSTRKTHGKKPENSIAASAGSSDVKILNETNAASRIKELKTDITDSEGQTSVNNIRGMENGNSPLEIDVHELIEQHIANMYKKENGPEVHVLSQTEDLGCSTKIDNQVLTEDLNEGFDETLSSTDSLLIGDQTDNNADVEVAKAKANKCLQPSPCVVDRVDGTREGNQVIEEDPIVPEKKGFAEIATSPDNLLFGDRTDIKTDVEVVEVEAYECLQRNPIVVDHVSEINGTSAQETLDYYETRQDNQVLPEGQNVPGNLGFAETGLSVGSPLLGDQRDIKTDQGMTEAEADKCLQPSPIVVQHAGGKNPGSDGLRQDNHVLLEGSDGSEKEGLAETGFVADWEVAEAEEDIRLQSNPSGVDYAAEVEGVSVEENQDSMEMKQDNQVFPDGSNISGNECFADTNSYAERPSIGDETNIEADREVAEVEEDISLQSNPSGVDYAAEVQGVFVQENQDSKERKQDNQFFPDVSNVSGNEDFTKTNSYAERPSRGDQTDIKTDLEVAEAEGDKCLQPSPIVVDHVSEVKPISAQESPHSAEIRQANDITSPLSCHYIDGDHVEISGNILDNNIKDTSPKGGVDGAFESCQRPGDDSHPKCMLELEVPSSGMLRRLEVDNLAEGNGTFHDNVASELAETNEDGYLNIHRGEYSVMYSDEPRKYKHLLAAAPIINSAEINLMTGHETDHTPKREETVNHQSLILEDCKSVEGGPFKGNKSKSVEGGPFKGNKSKCDEYGVFSVSKLFDAEERPVIMSQDKEIISGEHVITDFDEQGKLHGSPPLADTTMCHFARELEADLIAEGIEAYICNNKQSQSIGSDGSGCFKNQKSSKDEACAFNISHLFEGERSSRITPRDSGIISPGYTIKDSREQVTVPDFPSVSTTSANYKEVMFSADSSNLQEISPPTPNCVTESQEQPKSPLAKPTADANATKIQEAWNRGSEMAGHTLCHLEANAEANTSQVVEGSSTDEDANDAKCGKDEDFGGACITDVEVSTDCAISKIVVESLTDIKSRNTEETAQNLSKSLLASIDDEPTYVDSIQSWTGIELHNLFATSLNNDTSSEGTEVANFNLTMSANISISSNRGSLTKEEEKDMEEERSECEKITNENVILPSTLNEVSHTGFHVHKEENQHATPIKIDETCFPDTEFDGTVMSVTECFNKVKENAVTENKSDEKGQYTGYELEKSFCPGDPLSNSREDVTHNRLNDLDSVDGYESTKEQLSENTGECLNEANLKGKEASFIPLGESCLFGKEIEPATVDGCESPKEQLPENAGERLKDTNSITEAGEEENIIPLGESCLLDEAPDNDSGSTGKNKISLPGSPRNLDKLEVCQDMLTDIYLLESLSSKSRLDHEVTLSSEAAFETSVCDLQESNIPEKSHYLYTCSEDVSIFYEALIDKGTSPCNFSKASTDYKEVTERGESILKDADQYEKKTQDETDCDPTSSQGDQEYGKEDEKSSTATMVQFSISHLSFEEKFEDSSNHVLPISDVLCSGCNEILKESDVADTIKEYIDSESSLPMIIEATGPSLPIGVSAHTNEIESAALSKCDEEVARSEGDFDEPLVESLDGKSEELDKAIPDIEPAPDSAEGFTVTIPLADAKGNDVKLHSDGDRSSSKQLCSTVQKNARAILIHGTPGKLLAMGDMKENASGRKGLNAGDLATVRPAKRKALQDVHWK